MTEQPDHNAAAAQGQRRNVELEAWDPDPARSLEACRALGAENNGTIWRNLRFHDLRHTFGTRAVEQAESILEQKEWMGHANVQSTTRYLHYKSKADAAQRLAAAFADDDAAEASPEPVAV